jgi:acyl-CoA reductase-like NAD-dependent aldehyde dehydrogenase
MAFSIFENFQNIINGEKTSTTERRHGINPATGEPNPDVPVAIKEDVDRAVVAAQEAFKTWIDVPFDERRKALLAYADAIEEYVADFAKLLVQEQGKPVSHSIYPGVQL